MPDANIYMERRVAPRIKVNVPVKYRFLEDEKEIKTVLEHREKGKKRSCHGYQPGWNANYHGPGD